MALTVHVLRHFAISNQTIATEVERISGGGWAPGLMIAKLEQADASQAVSFDPDPDEACDHVAHWVRPVSPSAPGCEECLRIDARWVHLRICMSCGHVGCCDDSPHRHARAHHAATTHPLVRSLEPGETWGWCFVDEAELRPAVPRDRRPGSADTGAATASG